MLTNPGEARLGTQNIHSCRVAIGLPARRGDDCRAAAARETQTGLWIDDMGVTSPFDLDKLPRIP